MFFAMLPIELRRQVYEYVMGEETIHLTLGTKKKFGHFICEDSVHGEDAPPQDRECSCRVLVGGRESERLSGACVRLLRVCRRMYAFRPIFRNREWCLLTCTQVL